MVWSYLRKFGRLPNIIFPKTFNEKIITRILFDRDPRLVVCTDKYLARAYITEKLQNESCLPLLYAVIDRPEDIYKLKLPDSFVMKPNNSSGQIVFVRDQRTIIFGDLEQQVQEWLSDNYYLKTGEWAYSKIKPHVLFEELLALDSVPDDFKFNCFNGQVGFIEVHRGRFVSHLANIYDKDWNKIPAHFSGIKPINEEVAKPLHFDRMLNIAKILSDEFDFLRVDMYNIEGRIVVGELCCYPAACRGPIEPAAWDLQMGKYWKSKKDLQKL